MLFLNNAINHGVLGAARRRRGGRQGKSILFMIESNPGPGLGLLLAYLFFGPRALRPSAPAAIIIQFFGGIHEIYFPYVLMKPRLILAMIAGGAAGVGTFVVTGAGLVATPSPGSIFAYLAVTPKGGYFGVLARHPRRRRRLLRRRLGPARLRRGEAAADASAPTRRRCPPDEERSPTPTRP